MRRRREFEYALAARAPKKESFLQYIAYETSLESLRRKRKERRGIQRTLPSDFAVIKHLHFVFDRALRTFKSHEDLWLRWVDFTLRIHRHGGEKMIGRILPKCVPFPFRSPARGREPVRCPVPLLFFPPHSGDFFVFILFCARSPRPGRCTFSRGARRSGCARRAGSSTRSRT